MICLTEHFDEILTQPICWIFASKFKIITKLPFEDGIFFTREPRELKLLALLHLCIFLFFFRDFLNFA